MVEMLYSWKKCMHEVAGELYADISSLWNKIWRQMQPWERGYKILNKYLNSSKINLTLD